ncbi:ExbD/TolR family protein [Singulisphaera sp. PoT]|uniref:ExbD/TolR family protein n=1 Tax=Singulisphaera sp. PoT TaxID=3411797 RepID=UPI003BF581D3
MSASMSSEMSAEPNLTPLLDVVFQLITFFMLVINFSNENYDQRIKLPVAGSAQPTEDGQKGVDEDRLVLNISNQGHLLVNGKDLPSDKAGAEIRHLADLTRRNLDAAGVKKSADLPTTIILRADKGTEFSDLYALITQCQANGFRKFALKAMSGE